MLLNQARNVVALDEPFDRDAVARFDVAGFLEFIEEQFRLQRSMIDTRSVAFSTSNGNQLTNHYDTPNPSNRLRSRQVDIGTIRVTPNTRAYKLIFKHTIPFTGIVSELMAIYPTCALVRNPLSILASWNTIDAAYRDGQIQPYAATLTGGLKKRLGQFSDRLDRQIDLLCWHFEQYRPLLDRGAVIRYEDMVKTGGSALGIIAKSARRLNSDLKSYNANKLYDRDLMSELKKRLMRVRGAIWDFYAPASVEQLLDRNLALSSAKVTR